MNKRSRLGIPALLSWFDRAARDLPWRARPEPWRVLVSEAMLQQTRVAAVLPRYAEFVARFPDASALAAASEEEVLARWSGLGYYRRARNLHAAARAIVADHGGEVPDDREALLALPGIGAYTAGAVLSIAFHRPEPVVDGNVERVLSRLFLVTGNVKRGDAKRRVWALAREAVACGPPARVNQALMELGALVCLPKSPRCPDCPLAGPCGANRKGVAEELPVLPARRSPVDVVLAAGLARRGARVLLARHPTGDFLAGTWGPPFARVPDGEGLADALTLGLRDRYGIDARPGKTIGTVRHGITHHRITAHCLLMRVDGPGREDLRFATEAEGRSLALSSLARKLLRNCYGEAGTR